MHKLLKQLPSEQAPRKRGAGIVHDLALAKDHYPQHTGAVGDCKQCSSRHAVRKRSRFICAECGVHLCIGACFSLYHCGV